MKEKSEAIMTVENFKKVVGVHITVNHTGKMSGMQSLSTSCLCNPYCQQYAKDPEKVCSHCYATTQLKMYTKMQPCLEKNSEILCNRILKKNEMPLLNAAYFRFESFSDLSTEIQVINYFNICKANKHTNFALWTKNPFLIQKAIDNGHKKPKNLQIVLSSHYMNIQSDPSQWDFVDKVFTVYDKKYIKEHDVEINCGARSCLGCKKCYLKNKEVYINEKLK